MLGTPQYLWYQLRPAADRCWREWDFPQTSGRRFLKNSNFICFWSSERKEHGVSKKGSLFEWKCCLIRTTTTRFNLWFGCSCVARVEETVVWKPQVKNWLWPAALSANTPLIKRESKHSSQITFDHTCKKNNVLHILGLIIHVTSLNTVSTSSGFCHT